jgi:hypothetical protein
LNLSREKLLSKFAFKFSLYRYTSARAGHCVVAAGPYVVVFGGHGDDGWLVKQQVYYDDMHCIDRETGRWRRLAPAPAVAPPAGGAVSPAPRAFHTMTRVGDRVLLFGGFTGAEALNDTWWLHLVGLYTAV